MKKLFLTLLLLAGMSTAALSQNLAIKTNLLYDATSTINLGLEAGFAKRWSVDVSGNYNGWNFPNDKKMQHWMVQPELRFWLCENFNGHFFGLHGHFGDFHFEKTKIPFMINPELLAYRNKGSFYGAGIGYGYHLILSKRWSLEAEAGIGWIHSDYDRYKMHEGGRLIGHFSEDYFGITKLSLSLVFVII